MLGDLIDKQLHIFISYLYSSLYRRAKHRENMGIIVKNKLVNILEISLECVVGERGGSVVECRTPEREVGGSKPTTAVLCP